MADSACGFPVSVRTPAAVFHWLEDEDFRPEAKILYDPSLAGYLAGGCL